MKKNIHTFIVAILLSTAGISQNTGLSFSKAMENYLVTPNTSAIDVTSNFSFELWIKPTNFSEQVMLLQKGNCMSGSTYSYHLRIDTDSLLSFATNCNGNCPSDAIYQCATKIIPDECLHLAVVYSSSDLKIYFNGALQPGTFVTGSHCGLLTTTSIPLNIGGYIAFSGLYTSLYDGLIEEFRVWDKTLNASDILNNYENTLVGNEPDLILYYKFDEIISGPGETVINSAVSTGPALDAQTYSLSNASPSSSLNSCFEYVGISELNNVEALLFPNPSHNSLTLSLNGTIGEFNIKICDSHGKIVLQKTENSSNTELDISDFDDGVYFLTIFSDITIARLKFIKN
jgi:hypothetical protein